ncbi:MAG: T9SS type A sorting domain-containing protein [Flavobacteriales bacterium]
MFRLYIFLFLFTYYSSFGQFLNRAELSIIENNLLIPNPLTGGLNSAQLSNIDLNQNGKNDIFVFERIGDRVLCFLNDSVENEIVYSYSRKYSKRFPALNKWALLVDFNCDGNEDIFTYNDSYVKVYKNTSTSDLISFDTETEALVSDLGSISSAIIISGVDIPSFVDVDGDSDIDVLTFKQSGGYMEFHKNKSMELYGHCDSLIFELETDCWGEFFEGLNEYDLNTCDENPSQQEISIRMGGGHSGSSSLTLDIDGDDDMDIILGDVSFNNLNLLVNGGDSETALITSVNQEFPIGNGSSVSAQIKSFPAAFYVDVDNDNIKDIVVSPNTKNNAENFESLMLFKNTGNSEMPNFEFLKSNFLQEHMLDFGSSAYPSVLDYNNDGLFDLVVGNYGYHNDNNPLSQLALLRNIGSITEPNFEVVDRNFANISSIALDTSLNLSVSGLYPTFGDLDNDGDMDMIIGDSNGKIHYFKNISVTSEAQFELETVHFFGIDIGQHAAPFLFDMNNDNLLDLVIGQVNGTLSYSQNNGTETSPIFDNLVDSFGYFSVNNNESLYGYSTPFIFKRNGEIEMLVGSESGSVFHYNNISNNLEGNFNLVNDNFQNIKEGSNTAIVFHDFTNDGKKDLFMGLQSGGLFYFKNESTSNNTNKFVDLNFEVYPNPTQNSFEVTSNYNDVKLCLYSIQGKRLKTENFYKSTTINISALKPSVYLLSLEVDGKIEWRKILKQ